MTRFVLRFSMALGTALFATSCSLIGSSGLNDDGARLAVQLSERLAVSPEEAECIALDAQKQPGLMRTLQAQPALSGLGGAEGMAIAGIYSRCTGRQFANDFGYNPSSSPSIGESGSDASDVGTETTAATSTTLPSVAPDFLEDRSDDFSFVRSVGRCWSSGLCYEPSDQLPASQMSLMHYTAEVLIGGLKRTSTIPAGDEVLRAAPGHEFVVLSISARRKNERPAIDTDTFEVEVINDSRVVHNFGGRAGSYNLVFSVPENSPVEVRLDTLGDTQTVTFDDTATRVTLRPLFYQERYVRFSEDQIGAGFRAGEARSPRYSVTAAGTLGWKDVYLRNTSLDRSELAPPGMAYFFPLLRVNGTGVWTYSTERPVPEECDVRLVLANGEELAPTTCGMISEGLELKFELPSDAEIAALRVVDVRVQTRRSNRAELVQLSPIDIPVLDYLSSQ
jgi:hypothetical protein